MMVLAQLPSASPEGLGNWLIILACAFVMLNQGFGFFKNHVREDPRPGATYAEKPRVEKLERLVEDKADEASIEHRIDGIDEEIRKLHADRSESVARLHNRIEVLNTELRAELRDDIKGLHALNRDVLSAVSKLEGKIESKIE